MHRNRISPGNVGQTANECVARPQESAFNVLYGTYAEDKAKRPTKAFRDLATLVEKGLLKEVEDRYLVKFARRSGVARSVTLVDGEFAENEFVLSRLRWLIEEQDVRPEDILVLSMKKERIERLARFVESAAVPSIPPVHLAFKEKDELLGQRKRLTFSTVASAKGYDAYCVLLVSANESKLDVEGRASFYVGCTRAIEYLTVSGYARQGLVKELHRSVVDASSPPLRRPHNAYLEKLL